MAQQLTDKEKLIIRLIGIINGELPAKRNGLCICWIDDPDHADFDDDNIFLVDGRKVKYQEWKKYFGDINTNSNEQKADS